MDHSILFRSRARSCALSLLIIILTTTVGAQTRWKFDFSESPGITDAIKVKAGEIYSDEKGYGFDLRSKQELDETFGFFSARIPEGTYRLNFTFGDVHKATDTTVKVECRQLQLEEVKTKAGEYISKSVFVNIRNSRLPSPPKNAPGGSTVVLNEREAGILRWDDKLTIELTGQFPRLAALSIEAVQVPVVYLVGDSTVTDQPYEPGASWGQMLPRLLTGVAVANHAESGETLKSFMAELRLAKVLSQIRASDYVLIQFGHNDAKKQWPQTYVEAHSTYKDYLRVFIDEVRVRGATPVLITPIQRRVFDAQNHIRNTHGDYPEVVRALAIEEHVELIDLERMSRSLFEALGPDKAPLAFSAQGKDITHQNNYGAYELAKCVAQSIRQLKLPLAQQVATDFPAFDPAHPDDPERFHLAPSLLRSDLVPRGN